MNATHIPSLVCLQYVHVSIDTYSHLVHATCHSGEKVGHVKQYCLSAFTIMRVPKTIKINNSPSSTSKALSSYFQLWHFMHLTDILYNPQGQATVERAWLTLKNQLN